MQNHLAWIYPHNIKYYYPGRIINISEKDDKAELEDIDNKEKYIQKLSTLIYITNSNFNNISKIDDFLELEELNEGILLNSIRDRYASSIIYTQIGLPILIALNPYKNLNIYSEENRLLYIKSEEELKNLPPHIFKIGQTAYNNLKKGETSQSIIITGESGAGKTESVKLLLRYLTKVEPHQHKDSDIEQKILCTNPILESFGNARTLRNDNSSRFGKYIQIYFNKQNNYISHANINNYLLEQSRIISQSNNERNYHIFYQVLFASDINFRLRYKLCDESGINFDFKEYINLDYDRKNKIHEFDVEMFNDNIKNMDLLNFGDDKKDDIFKIISSVLHLNLLTIIESKEDGGYKIEDSFSFDIISEFIGIDKKDINYLLCYKSIIDPISKNKILQPQSESAIKTAIQTLSKVLYSSLFDHIIYLINKSLSTNIENNNIISNNKYDCISLLDIFGFEIFPVNSFEQLCINFTNEKLQQHFNEHMFLMEKKIYNEENVEFNFTNLPDNKNIIEMIEKRGGLLDLLDEQNKFSSGNDKKFLAQLNNYYGNNPIFISKANTINTDNFGIKHFAGDVDYTTLSFVEKNKNNLNKELKEIFSNSKNNTINYIFKNINDNNGKNISVSSIFKQQLNSLINNLNKSLSLYVRCIKPNSERSDNLFESKDICRQLRCSGILEAVKVRKAGYGVRKDYKELCLKWNILIKAYCKINKDNSNINIIKDTLNNLLKRKNILEQNKDLFSFGNTKLFMKEEFCYLIDSFVNIELKGFAIIIQKNIKRFITQKKYKKYKYSVNKIIKQYKIYKFRKIITNNIINKNKFANYAKNIINLSINFNLLNKIIVNKEKDIKRETKDSLSTNTNINNPLLSKTDSKLSNIDKSVMNESVVIEPLKNIKNKNLEINTKLDEILLKSQLPNINIIKEEPKPKIEFVTDPKIISQLKDKNLIIEKLSEKLKLHTEFIDSLQNKLDYLEQENDDLKLKLEEQDVISGDLFQKVELVNTVIEEKDKEIEKWKYMYYDLKKNFDAINSINTNDLHMSQMFNKNINKSKIEATKNIFNQIKQAKEKEDSNEEYINNLNIQLEKKNKILKDIINILVVILKFKNNQVFIEEKIKQTKDKELEAKYKKMKLKENEYNDKLKKKLEKLNNLNNEI